jgi:LysM repeat protein
MQDDSGAGEEVGDRVQAGLRAPGTVVRPRRMRRVLAVPLAVVSTVAVTLGIVQPAEAAPSPPRRTAKAKANRTATMPALAAVAPAASVPMEVTVVEGDTVSSIAERYGVATAELLASNGLGWSSPIFPGQRLALPGGGHAEPGPAPAPVPEIARHVVAPGDTVSDIAAEHGLTVDQVLSANGLGRESLIFPGQAIVLPSPQPPDSAVAAPPAPESGVAPAPAPEVAAALPVAMISVPLSHEMRASARIVIDVGRALGVPDQGIVVALAAAAQESGLRNVHHGDHGSLGLFQQRPSEGWGTPEEVVDPVRAATAFYGGATNPNAGRTLGLLDIAGWESLTVTQAAQAVQRSSHPDHYAKWEASARAWLSELG